MPRSHRLVTSEPWVPLREERWELFAMAVAGGKPVGQSYMDAGYTQNKHSADRLGTRLLAKPIVQARVAYVCNNHHLSREELLALLARCARSPTSSLKDRISAGQECSRMMGWNRGPKAEDGPGQGEKVRGMAVGSPEFDKLLAAAMQEVLKGQEVTARPEPLPMSSERVEFNPVPAQPGLY